MSDTAVKHYIDELHRLQESLPGDKLSLIREAAMGQFQARGFPTTRQENWKYTDVKPIARSAFGIAEAKPAAGYEKQLELARLSGLESHELVFINGRFSVEHSRLQDLPQGVVLEDIVLWRPGVCQEGRFCRGGFALGKLPGADVERKCPCKCT